MANKVIPRALLDEALDMNRSYRNSGEPGVEEVFECFYRIQSKVGISWSSLWNLCAAISAPILGLKPDVTNEEIYAILRLLGWEVSD